MVAGGKKLSHEKRLTRLGCLRLERKKNEGELNQSLHNQEGSGIPQNKNKAELGETDRRLV